MLKKSLHSPCSWSCEIILTKGALRTSLCLYVIHSDYPLHLLLIKTTFCNHGLEYKSSDVGTFRKTQNQEHYEVM